jgi:hypothetical protein
MLANITQKEQIQALEKMTKKGRGTIVNDRFFLPSASRFFDLTIATFVD